VDNATFRYGVQLASVCDVCCWYTITTVGVVPAANMGEGMAPSTAQSNSVPDLNRTHGVR